MLEDGRPSVNVVDSAVDSGLHEKLLTTSDFVCRERRLHSLV
jgi:hypothetical protein